MEERVTRIENDHRDLAAKHNAAQEDRQRDLGLVYSELRGMQADLRLIKWFAGIAGASVIVYLITLLAERVWL